MSKNVEYCWENVGICQKSVGICGENVGNYQKKLTKVNLFYTEVWRGNTIVPTRFPYDFSKTFPTSEKCQIG